MTWIVAWVIFLSKCFHRKLTTPKALCLCMHVQYHLYYILLQPVIMYVSQRLLLHVTLGQTEQKSFLKYTGTADTPFLLLLPLIGNINPLLKKKDFIVHCWLCCSVLFCFLRLCTKGPFLGLCSYPLGNYMKKKGLYEKEILPTMGPKCPVNFILIKIKIAPLFQLIPLNLVVLLFNL